ncbi:hypothetical protein F0562_029170 [Nyssa sinensis]|uniref:Uncharacterized protein n=1 Tax=Nyssa sinensis TaxID=561372 RepID=A0A5J5B4B5_9ASTE|nr:hypothetical protein F0562_029170 [Nyssa sinensis]
MLDVAFSTKLTTIHTHIVSPLSLIHFGGCYRNKTPTSTPETYSSSAESTIYKMWLAFITRTWAVRFRA